MEARAKQALSAEQAERLRQIPSVDELLAQPRLAALAGRVDRKVLLELTRTVLAELRSRITDRLKFAVLGELTLLAGDSASLEEHISSMVERILAHSLQPVINATGVILHTNLGRAPLSAAVVEEFRRAATQYTNLEYDLEAGARGKRDVHTSSLLERLTGAEAAIVVNNCAAAVLLVLRALAKGDEVIVSRGELIEIGDGFRIPDIMAESGAVLREVGTTNRTRLSDYERGINERTRMLLRVHRSNFQIAGFTAQPSLEELVKLGRKASLPVYEDLGSGCLVNLSSSGVTEPVVRESVAAGVSVISFSGDKLLGGPQAGIILGDKELIARIRRHPMFRALRVDKLTIAALEATLLAYLRGTSASGHDAIPAIRMIRASAEEIGAHAKNIIELLRANISENVAKFEMREGKSVIGGGSTPGQLLPTHIIAIECLRCSSAELEERLRAGVSGGIPIIARVEDHRLILDLRTVFPEQESALVESLSAALAK